MDKFRIVSGGNNFTLDYLNAGDSHEHVFTVRPIKKTWHRIRPAKMAFIDGVEGENTIMHMSNSLGEIRIAPHKNIFMDYALVAGRVLTLNMVKSTQGWMVAGGVLLFGAALQLYLLGSKVLHQRRHLRALEEVKDM